MNLQHLLRPATAAALICAGACAGAQPAERPQDARRGPPPEAIAACSGKTAGAAVTFTGRNGKTFSGTCQQDGKVLAARPSGAPAGAGREGAPPAK
jgi:hypothetical protein